MKEICKDTHTGRETGGQSLQERVASIVTRCLRTGEKLPTERQMVHDLGVSRTILREALSVFEANGMITSQQGSGRYVQIPNIGMSIFNTWSIVIRANPSMLLNFFEIRCLLEIHSLPQAVERANVNQIREMHNQVQVMLEKAKGKEAFVKEDREFHRILFESTGNILLEQLLNAFWDLFDAFVVEPAHADLESAAIQHQLMLNAFTRKDVPLLADLMRDQCADARLRIMNAIIQYEKNNMDCSH